MACFEEFSNMHNITNIKPSSKIFLLTVPRRYSFVDHLCYLCLVLVMLLRLFIAALCVCGV